MGHHLFKVHQEVLCMGVEEEVGQVGLEADLLEGCHGEEIGGEIRSSLLFADSLQKMGTVEMEKSANMCIQDLTIPLTDCVLYLQVFVVK